MSRMHFGMENPVRFSPRERDDLDEGMWSISCPEVTIDNRDGRRLSGPGYIRQDGPETLRWSLIDSNAAFEPRDVFRGFGVPGKWLPDDSFFSFEAVDFQGREWSSSDVRPRFEGAVGGVGTCAQGTLTHVHCSGDFRPDRSYVRLTFRGRLRLLQNVSVETRRIIEGQEPSSSFDREVGRLSAHGRELIIHYEPDMTRMLFRGREEHPLLPDFASRLEELVWFLAGQGARWAVAEQGCVSDGSRLEVRTFGRALPARWFKPPLNPSDPETWKYCEGLAFEYLAHVAEHPAGTRHATSVDAWRVYQASSRAPEDLMLMTCLAIEGAVRRYYKEACSPTSGIEKRAVELAAYLEAWEGPEVFKSRLLRAVESWKGPNAREGLKNLVSLGILREEHRQVWERRRHAQVHRTGEGSPDKRSLFEDILTLHQAWLLLVTDAMGYKGPVTDWTSPGWPLMARAQADAPDEAEA